METEQIENRIGELTAETKAQFGIMLPQHMIEHLSITLKVSFNKIKLPEFNPSEKQISQKMVLIHSEIEFPKGIRAPGLDGNLLPLKFSDLKSAKTDLMKSLVEFNTYFLSDPDAKTIHPRFGMLSHEEWEIFHQKHFEHHLKQFGI